MHACRHVAAMALAVGFILSAHPSPAVAQSQDHFVGTWVLDTEHSMYEPARFAPERRILMVEAEGNAVRHTIKTWRPGARTDLREVSYLATYDGPEVTVRENGAVVKLMRKDAMTVARHAMAQGGAMEDQEWKLSEDGQMLTITADGHDAAGNTFHSMQVYHREDAD